MAHRVALLALLGEHTRSLCGSPRRAAGAAGVYVCTWRAAEMYVGAAVREHPMRC